MDDAIDMKVGVEDCVEVCSIQRESLGYRKKILKHQKEGLFHRVL